MKILGGVVPAIMVLFSLFPSQPAIGSGDVTLSFGGRLPTLQGGVNQYGLAIDGSLGRRGWPLQLTAYASGFMESHAATVWPPNDDYVSGHRRTLTSEIGLGIGKTLSIGSFHPYLAGGMHAVNVQVRETAPIVTYEASGKDTSHGPWVNVGGFWRFGSGFRIGGGARFTRAEVGRYRSPGGGTQIALRVGREWPDTRE